MDSHLVGNKSLEFHTQNPTDFSVLKKYHYMSDAVVDAKIDRSWQAFHAWRKTSVPERANLFVALAQALRSQAGPLAHQMALEMGKPLRDGLAEVEKCAVTSEYYAQHLEAFLQPTEVLLKNVSQRVVKEPLGPIFAIMPWNFPLWQVVRSLVPILASGNTYLLKHSTIVAGCAEMMSGLFSSVFPAGVADNLFMTHEQTAKWFADPRLRGVTMTGSSRGGRQVGAAAGAQLKKVLLELGGSDAYIVLDDADIEQAGALCAKSRLINNGQSCISAKRFFVPPGRLAQFAESMMKTMQSLEIGDPLSAKTELGPLASRAFQEQLRKQVELIQRQGASLLWQRAEQDRPGAFFPPTILQCQGQEGAFLQDEFFGPVALVHEYEHLDQAVQLANASPFGLGGAVFSANRARAEGVSRQLECGFVAINDFVRSDAALPFGGVKDSGFGRELGVWGINEFTNQKTLFYG